MATGAEIMFRTAARGDINVCFANPGTTEMPMVAALDRVEGMRAVLALFEGVCSGAADGYARVTGRPALTMFHLGPGFANSLANQHNARRSNTPVVNLIGDQTRTHLAFDAPLTSDIEKLTTWAGWHRYVQSPNDIATDTAAAVLAATSNGGGPASLVIPADVTWEQAPDELPNLEFGTKAVVASDRIESVAPLLAKPGTAIILTGLNLTAEVATNAVRLAAATGCAVFQYRVSNVESGRGTHRITDVPYFPEQAMAALADVSTAVLIGGEEPVTFFGYEGIRSTPLPDRCRRVELAGSADDAAAALSDLVAAVDAPEIEADDSGPIEVPTGVLDPMTLGQGVAALMPDGAILVQEGITSSGGLRHCARSAAPHRMLTILGGAIGGGLPTAVGAAVGAPDRPVVAFQADGSSMYTIQSLWTMARENLDITVVLCNNQRYAILQVEMARSGIEVPGPIAESLTRLDSPALDFTALAKAMGVPATRASTADELCAQLARSIAEPGPHLIEAML